VTEREERERLGHLPSLEVARWPRPACGILVGVLTRLDLTARPATTAAGGLAGVLPRAAVDVEAATHAVRPIIEAVRERGADAVREATLRLDGVRLDALRVPAEALAEALERLDPDVRAALTEAVRRVRIVHEAQLPAEQRVEVVPGGAVTRRHLPVDRVGLYVPGGIAPLVSSVLMNVVPAQVAGVESIALSSTPQKDHGGLPHPTILAACALLGIDEVYAVGGAQAIAMFAYGVGPCQRVDLVTGPGSIYTVTAKRLLKGVVGIDSEAGPTEIAILADDTAEAPFVAADLVSQAEHDPLAAAVLVTPSERLAAAVEAELETQVAATKHAQRILTSLGGAQSAIVMVDDLEQGLAVVDAYAAEHLEIHTADAAAYAARVRNAGAIFVGPHAPVSLGDYCAGSNHVLPTGGCACHSSGLSVRAFTKSVHVVDYSREALAEVADHVTTLAEAEDLPGHGAAVRVRFTR
jgi:histidinol dehydrogenase